MIFINIADLKKIKLEIEKNEIDLEEAKEKLFESKNTRSWHTKEWRELSKNKLKDKCEQCGKNENLTMQHTWHPKKYGEIKGANSFYYSEKLKIKYPKETLVSNEEVEDYITKNYIEIERKVCWKCNSVNIAEYKTQDYKYRCNRCKRKYDEIKIVKILALKNEEKRRIDRNTTEETIFDKEKHKLYMEKIKIMREEKYSRIIEKETLLELIDEYIKYQSLEDTVTYCKMCAFMKDKNFMEICPVCNKRYKQMQYKTCYVCRGN